MFLIARQSYIKVIISVSEKLEQYVMGQEGRKSYNYYTIFSVLNIVDVN